MNVEIARGDQIPLNFKIKNNSGVYLKPSDLTEITMTCRLKPNKKSQILFQKKLSNNTITYDEQEEKFVIPLLSEDTINLDYRDYGFDIEIIVGELIDSHIGKLTVTEKYTYPES